jgi:hypothetical protein
MGTVRGFFVLCSLAFSQQEINARTVAQPSTNDTRKKMGQQPPCSAAGREPPVALRGEDYTSGTALMSSLFQRSRPYLLLRAVWTSKRCSDDHALEE